MSRAVRVVVVDDSSIARRLIRDVLQAEGDITVVGEAADGAAALRTIASSSPDLVTVDLDMPGMDGLELIRRIMATTPLPVIVVTAKELGSELVSKAVRRGALGLARKPAPGKGGELRKEVRRLARVPVVRHVGSRTSSGPPPPSTAHEVRKPALLPLVGIAASAGGPVAVAALLRALPESLPACVAVVQHLPRNYAPHFASYLAENTRMRVVIAAGRTEPKPGVVVVAPDDAHLVVSFGGWLATSDDDRIGGHRPSATALFRSMARWVGPAGIGVVLSGIGNDGAEGLLELRTAGGLTIAQDQATSGVYGMPKAARESGAAAQVLALDQIAPAVLRALAAGAITKRA